MISSLTQRNLRRGFTLIELLCVIAILCTLITFTVPAMKNLAAKSRSVKCGGNLKGIWAAVNLYSQENEGKYPFIETNPENPMYLPEENAKGMLETLEPYGISKKDLQCPEDLGNDSYFARLKTSYEWNPMLDGENTSEPQLYRRGRTMDANLRRLRLVSDFEFWHLGGRNSVRGDGTVTFQ